MGTQGNINILIHFLLLIIEMKKSEINYFIYEDQKT